MKYKKICKRLGKTVRVPPDGKTMILVEIYSNGNVGCIPLDCSNYLKELRQYHGSSIKSIKSMDKY